jgi:flagellar biosynthesis chaperone FliJ
MDTFKKDNNNMDKKQKIWCAKNKETKKPLIICSKKKTLREKDGQP